MKTRERKLILVIIILISLLIGMSINSIINSKVTLLNGKQIIKEMTEGEYESKLTELNTSHEDYALEVQANKQKIADAITNAGVETLATATADEMAINIGKLKNTEDKQILYSAGEEFNSKTGGWVTLSSADETNNNVGGNTPSIGAQSKGVYGLSFGDTGTGMWGYGGFKTNSYIDLSKYNTLIIKGKATGSADHDWVRGFNVNLYDGTNRTIIYKTLSFDGIEEIDISEYTGNYIITLCAYDFSQRDNNMTGTIYQVSLI